VKAFHSRFFKVFYLIFIFSFSCLLSGCGDKATEAPADSAVQKLNEANAKALEAERLLKLKAEFEKQAAEKAKVLVEQQLKETSDDAKSNERIAWILGVCVFLALIVGIAMGSSSRKKADSKNHKLD
jgi:outer membrane murein-binding lipoprotein Lpp